MPVKNLFVTKFYREPIGGKNVEELRDDLRDCCYLMAEEDEAGIKWCEDNHYRGYTSYASLNDLVGHTL